MIRCDSPNYPLCDARINPDPEWTRCLNGHSQTDAAAANDGTKTPSKTPSCAGLF